METTTATPTATAPAANSTRTRFNTLLRTLLVAGTLVGVLGVPAAHASKAPPAGSYRGNQCLEADRYLGSAGIDACYWVQNRQPERSFQLTPAAHDWGRDGYSAESIITVHQYVDGRWAKSREVRVVASDGAGTSKVGQTVTINKMARATHVGIVIRACRFDSPTNVRYGCDEAHAQTLPWRTLNR